MSRLSQGNSQNPGGKTRLSRQLANAESPGQRLRALSPRTQRQKFRPHPLGVAISTVRSPLDRLRFGWRPCSSGLSEMPHPGQYVTARTKFAPEQGPLQVLYGIVAEMRD